MKTMTRTMRMATTPRREMRRSPPLRRMFRLRPVPRRAKTQGPILVVPRGQVSPGHCIDPSDLQLVARVGQDLNITREGGQAT